MPNTFTCHKCNQSKINHDTFTTGYARDDQNNKICFDCCADVDKEHMQKHGKITLYLTKDLPKGQVTHPENRITNWCNTLSIKPYFIRKGRHNIAKTRYDVWFRYEGQEWHGVQYGDDTQLCHCKRLKGTKPC